MKRERRAGEQLGKAFGVFRAHGERGDRGGIRQAMPFDEAEEKIAVDEIPGGDGVEPVAGIDGEGVEDDVGIGRLDEGADLGGVSLFLAILDPLDKAARGDRKFPGAEVSFRGLERPECGGERGIHLWD